VLYVVKLNIIKYAGCQHTNEVIDEQTGVRVTAALRYTRLRWNIISVGVQVDGQEGATVDGRWRRCPGVITLIDTSIERTPEIIHWR